MSAQVKLSSKLPGDPEINGLDAHAGDLHEEITLVAITWITPRELRKVIATGEEVPIVEIRRIEPIGTPDQVPQAIIDLAAQLHERRTGRTALPIDALDSPKGDVDELDDDPIPDDAEIFGDSREPLEGQEPIEFDDEGYEEPAPGERVRMLRPTPRVAQDPSQIGEAFAYGDDDAG